MTAQNFEQQVIHSKDILMARAVKLSRDITKAEDLVQETVYRALSNKDKYREDYNLKGWLYTIMRNIFINDYNRQAKHPTYLQEDYTDHLLGGQSHVATNDGIGNITMSEIEKAMDKLDDKYSKIFMMHYEGFKYQEIADEVNLPLGTVKSRIHIARGILQKELAEFR